jgi:hypothetical protein
MRNVFIPIALCASLLCFANVPSALGEGCDFENQAYFQGQVVCQNGNEMKCTADGWQQTGNECTQSDEDEAVRQPEAAGPGSVQNPEEPSVPQVPAVPPATE